jgi:catechol 2,3-dioxygenase-like lactoylglutathione lyase family enzyme
MAIKRIATIAVMVSDEDKAKKWYKSKLGFEIMSNESHWIVVGPKGSSTGLHLCPDEKLEPGNQGIVLKADNVEKTYQDLKKKGVEFTRELAKSEWDEEVIYAMLKDPDGNVFWLMQK